MKNKKQIQDAESKTEGITTRSGAEVYIERHSWECPPWNALLSRHALTRKPFWLEILASKRNAPVSDSEPLDNHLEAVKKAWPHYLELLSWWQFKRFFNRAGNSITCKPFPDVVVVHPQPRFTTAENRQQWEEACRWALLAYCNHGECCSETTFRDKDQLDSLPSETQTNLMHRFVFAREEARTDQTLTQCPPHIRRKYLRLGALGTYGNAEKHSGEGYRLVASDQIRIHRRESLGHEAICRHVKRRPAICESRMDGGRGRRRRRLPGSASANGRRRNTETDERFYEDPA